MTSGRVARKREERVREIVAVAADLFGEHGYDAVGLEDVAERLDLTRASLYYYFANKEELATAAITTIGSVWTARLEELAAAHDGPPAERLRALLREHVTIAVCDHPAALRLFVVPHAWPAAQAAAVKRLRRRHDRVFRAVVREGVDAGDFTVTGTDTVLQCMHAAMSQAPRWCGPLRGRARARAVDELVDTLLMLVGVAPR